MKSARRRVDVNLDELDRVLDGARQEPLSEADYEKIRDALHAMAAMLVRPRNRPAPYWMRRKAQVKLRLNRISARRRRPDTGTMEPRPSVAHDRWRSRIKRSETNSPRG